MKNVPAKFPRGPLTPQDQNVRKKRKSIDRDRCISADGEKGNQNQMLSSRLEQVTLRREVPEHLDQGVWEGVEVDVELALCWMLVNLEETFCTRWESTHARRRSWCKSLVTCYHAPSAQPSTGRPR